MLHDNPEWVRVEAVTGLEGGVSEYEAIVVPYFRSRHLPVPDYCHDFSGALDRAAWATGPLVAVIGTPTGHHAAQTAAALEAGCHTYVERPVCGPNDNLPSLLSSAQVRDLVFFTGCQRRVERIYTTLLATFERYAKGGVSSIHCFLASGHRPSGWRARAETGGGGIILDEGYHLLDIAMWMLTRLGSPDRLGVKDCWTWTTRETQLAESTIAVETTALGAVQLESGVFISFNLSYAAPRGSVSERLEVRDAAGSSFRLDRTQATRASTAAVLTCQRSDGKVLTIEDNGRPLDLWEADLGAEAAAHRPLQDFLGHVRAGHGYAASSTHPCSARSVVGTWRLVRSIYASALPKESAEDLEDV